MGSEGLSGHHWAPLCTAARGPARAAVASSPAALGSPLSGVRATRRQHYLQPHAEGFSCHRRHGDRRAHSLRTQPGFPQPAAHPAGREHHSRQRDGPPLIKASGTPACGLSVHGPGGGRLRSVSVSGAGAGGPVPAGATLRRNPVDPPPPGPWVAAYPVGGLGVEPRIEPMNKGTGLGHRLRRRP